MTNLILPSSRIIQPNQRYRYNADFANHIAFCVVNGFSQETIHEKGANYANTHVANTGGIGCKAELYDTSYAAVYNTRKAVLANDFTAVTQTYAITNSSSDWMDVLSIGDGSGNDIIFEISSQTYFSSPRIYNVGSIPGTLACESTVGVVDGKLHTLVFQVGTSSAQIWLDGILIISSGHNLTATQLTKAGVTNRTALTPFRQLGVAALNTAYVLTNASVDARSLSQNPWQIFASKKRVIYFDLGAGGSVSGALAATETGSDTFAATGSVLVEGALAATESGSDTFQGSGAAVASGDLAAMETGSDVFAASGTQGSTGTIAATESGSDTFAATGDVVVSGTLAATETGSDTFQGSGAAVASGDLAATETGSDTFFASGTQVSTGTLAATETGSDTFSASGDVIISGTVSATETSSDTFYAVGGNVSAGSLAAAETGADTFAATGSVLVAGTLAATEQADTFSATGNVLVSGTLAATEIGQDTFSSAGGAVVAGTLAATETGSDTFAASGTQVATGTLAATEQSDTFSATGNVIVSGTLAATESGRDTFLSYGGAVISGVLSATEMGADIFAAYDPGSSPSANEADLQWSVVVKAFKHQSLVKGFKNDILIK